MKYKLFGADIYLEVKVFTELAINAMKLLKGKSNLSLELRQELQLHYSQELILLYITGVLRETRTILSIEDLRPPAQNCDMDRNEIRFVCLKCHKTKFFHERRLNCPYFSGQAVVSSQFVKLHAPLIDTHQPRGFQLQWVPLVHFWFSGPFIMKTARRR